jgi:hypothetical protein
MKRTSKGKRPEFYDSPVLDQMMSMIMVLASEVSVLADEMDTIKRAVSAKAPDIAAELAAFVPDEQALQERETRRQEMLARLFYLVRKDAEETAEQATAKGYLKTIEEIAVK